MITLPHWVILPATFNAIRFHARITSANDGSPSAISFHVFSVCQSVSADGADTTWELIDCGNTWPLDQWQEAFCEIDGDVKWDGCINWQTNPDTMMHGCGPRHVDQIQAIFATVYHVAKRHMDLLGDEVPPMPDGAIEITEIG